MNNYGFEPFNDWVLIIPEQGIDVIGKTLYISDDAVHKPQRGEVVAVGPGRLDESIGVHVGDVLFFQEHGTIKLQLNETDLLLVNKAQMMGRFFNNRT